MAVPKQRVIDLIKARLIPTKVNLSNAKIDAIAARLCPKPADDADDAAINALIEDFDSMQPFIEIAAEEDRFRTLEAKSKLPDPNKPAKTPEEIAAEAKAKADAEALEAAKGKSDTPEYIKTLMATIEGLKADIVEVKTGKVLETKQSLAKAAFEKSEKFKALPEAVKAAYLGRIQLDSETPFEDQITSLEAEHDVYVQHIADSQGYSGAPGQSKVPDTVDQATIDSLVSRYGV